MRIYEVGGAVRDALLGLPVTERDWVVVGGSPEELAALGFKPQMPRALAELLEVAGEPLKFLESLNDPNNVYAYCFCDVR
jgi:hypothetical protein